MGFIKQSSVRAYLRGILGLVLYACILLVPLIANLWFRYIILKLGTSKPKRLFAAWANCTISAFDIGLDPASECGSYPPSGVILPRSSKCFPLPLVLLSYPLQACNDLFFIFLLLYLTDRLRLGTELYFSWGLVGLLWGFLCS
jgi:hypothetical protein